MARFLWLLTLACLALAGWRASTGRWGLPRSQTVLPPTGAEQLDSMKAKAGAPQGVSADLELTLLPTDPYITPVAFGASATGPLVADNMSGWIARIGMDGGSLPLNDRAHMLQYARAMTGRPGQMMVADNLGIEIFDSQGRFLRRVEPGISFFSFAALDNGGYAINPFVRGSLEPLVEVLDSNGVRVHDFSPALAGPAGQRAVVAGCGDSLFAAQTEGLGAWLFNLRTKSAVAMVPPYPNARSLLSGAQRVYKPGLPDPTPTFAAGVACDANRFYLLADYPRPLLMAFDKSGRLEGTRTTLHTRSGFHFQGLAVQGRPGGTEVFYTITTDAERKYWLGRISSR